MYDPCNFIDVDLSTNNFDTKRPGVFNPAKKYPFGLGSERSASVNHFLIHIYPVWVKRPIHCQLEFTKSAKRSFASKYRKKLFFCGIFYSRFKFRFLILFLRKVDNSKNFKGGKQLCVFLDLTPRSTKNKKACRDVVMSVPSGHHRAIF